MHIYIYIYRRSNCTVRGEHGYHVRGSFFKPATCTAIYSRECLGHHRKGTPETGHVDCVFFIG